MHCVRRLTLIVFLWSGYCGAQTPELEIRGVEGDVRDNILAHLSLRDTPCDIPSWRLKRLFAAAEQEIQEAVTALGYYHAVLRQKHREDGDCWSARFSIDLGPRTTFATIDVRLLGEAADDPAFALVVDKLPIVRGDPLHHGKYEEAKKLLESLANERGYFDARFVVSELRVDPAFNRADIRLHIDSGPRYQFGEVRIDQDILDPDFVQRYVTVKPGDPYSSRILTTLNNALSSSGYFTSVDIRPRVQDAVKRQVPVDVTLSARERHYYTLGAGIDTDTGPRLTANYENRRVNRQGHQYSLNLKVSPVLSQAGTEYKIPLADPTRESLSFRAGYQHEDTDSTDSNSYLLGSRWVVIRDNGWMEARTLDLVHESFTSGDDRGSSTLLVPGLAWSRSHSDNPLRVGRGHRLDFEVRGSHEALLSDTDFVQFRGFGKGIYSLPWNGRIIGRAEVGATAVDDFSKLPASFRFFAGGDQSVRGYDYKELGPPSARGDTSGGRYLYVFSLEYDHPILENWRIAAFVDTGNASDNLDFDFKTGVGGGIRWHTPIGPLRLDIAFPLDPADENWRIHFTMGAEL